MPGTSPSLPYHTLQGKVSKPPAPRENPQRLCEAGLAPPGQTHPSQAGTPVLPSLSTGVMAQLPLLMATGTGLQLLPCWDSSSWKTSAMIEACGWRAPSLSKMFPTPEAFPNSDLWQPAGKAASKILGKHFGNPKISLSECSSARQLAGARRALDARRGGRAAELRYLLGKGKALPLTAALPLSRSLPSPAFPGRSISQPALYPIPAAPFPALTTTAPNAACPVPALRAPGRCQPELRPQQRGTRGQ